MAYDNSAPLIGAIASAAAAGSPCSPPRSPRSPLSVEYPLRGSGAPAEPIPTPSNGRKIFAWSIIYYTAIVGGFSAAAGACISDLSITHTEDNSSSISWPYYLDMALMFLLEALAVRLAEGPVILYNVLLNKTNKAANLGAETPMNGRGRPDKAQATKLEELIYRASILGLAIKEVRELAFVYLSLMTWIENYKNNNAKHYSQINYKQDAIVFSILLVIMAPYLFYGVINPAAKGIANYPQSHQGTKSHISRLPSALQKFFYVSGVGLAATFIILAIFLLFPPQFIKERVDSISGLVGMLSLAGFVAIPVFLVTVMIKHHFEGFNFRDNLNENLIPASRVPKSLEWFARNFGFLLGIAMYAGKALPIKAFSSKIFLSGTLAPLFFSLSVTLYSNLAFVYGEWMQLKKRHDEKTADSLRSESASAASVSRLPPPVLSSAPPTSSAGAQPARSQREGGFTVFVGDQQREGFSSSAPSYGSFLPAR